ncbi:MAG: type I-B CRISPR-associated protein Cas7/Csh2 [Nitrososphaerota archaeon]
MKEEVPNSEILLIYEAKMCNPNGDPDAENRPRIDPKTNTNLVSDVRLKRFFRDYIVERFGEDYIYVTKIASSSVRAQERVEKLLGTTEESKLHEVLNKCIDARLFGATIPIGKEEGRGVAKSYIGPVQFTWGFSLHPVELVDSSTITSVFSGREKAEKYGTIGKDWRIYYSLIGFYGVVSGRRAKGTGMTMTDLKILDDFMWKALQVQPTTRSKIGEMPHLYMRVEYNDAETVLGDLRKFITVKPLSTAIRDFKDLEINFDRLIKHLERNKDVVSKIYLKTSEELNYVVELVREHFGEQLSTLPHGMKEEDVEAAIKRT